MRMTGFVYAIGGDNGRVKIGWSADPWRCRMELQANHSEPLTLLGMIAATREQENEIQVLLKRWCIIGEWFHREKVVNAFIAMLPPDAC